MTDGQKIKVDGREYFIVDSMQDFRAEDSFIHNDNKLARFTGNGESKKHVGTYSGELGEKISKFFDYDRWGTPHSDPNKNNWKTVNSAQAENAIVSNRCFFSKSNLLKYLTAAKEEYFQQEQVYHDDISAYYDQRYNELQQLSSNPIYFTIYDASDNWDKKQNRGYIRSDDKIWSVWRKLILPSISYLSILKLDPVDDPNSEPYFYFRILLDYQYRSFVHPSISAGEPESDAAEEAQKKAASSTFRQGAAKFKREVHDHMPQCPFTFIKDERLLIASHIKPHAACIKEGRTDQDVDKLNGLSLSPTYDTLFDQGYITFTDNGELICGSLLSPYTWEKLNINPNARNKMRIYPEGREEYLDFHRTHVFQDDISELV
ncbi:MAG: HNH endonuclease [bacterium]|nr:HNH endonuclease [bacterium]